MCTVNYIFSTKVSVDKGFRPRFFFNGLPILTVQVQGTETSRLRVILKGSSIVLSVLILFRGRLQGDRVPRKDNLYLKKHIKINLCSPFSNTFGFICRLTRFRLKLWLFLIQRLGILTTILPLHIFRPCLA